MRRWDGELEGLMILLCTAACFAVGFPERIRLTRELVLELGGGTARDLWSTSIIHRSESNESRKE